MRTKGLELLLNILFFVLTAWMISSIFSIQQQEFELIDGVETIKVIRNGTLIWKLLLCVGVSALLFYANLWNILRLKNHNRTKLEVTLWSLGCLLLAIVLFLLLEKLVFYSSYFPLDGALRNAIVFFYFTISTAYGLGKVWLASERQQQQLLLGKKQAELNLLRNQLQSHFLFNALNNLLAMVDQAATPQLALAIEQLSKLLRYVTDETQTGQVSIGQEIEFIRNYVEVQLLRFAPGEVDFQVEVIGSYTEQSLEPGLFIPFVENAFKFGTEPEQRTTIQLVFDVRAKGQVHFYCHNQCLRTDAIPKREGTGIKSTQERLQLVYPGQHSLIIEKNGSFSVNLTIQTL